METIIKRNIEQIKNDIKSLVEKQKFYRNQRKEVYIIGNREITTNEATYLHRLNGHKLRLLYAAYGILRDKSFSQTENHYPEDNHPLNSFKLEIDKLVDKYKMLVEV